MTDPHKSRFDTAARSDSDLAREVEPSVSCVVPCEGAVEALSPLVVRLLDELSALVQNWELILVDDGYPEPDARTLAQWVQVSEVRVIRLARRFGRSGAIAAGLWAANGDVVVAIQGDDAEAPGLIAELLSRWHQGADIAYTARTDMGFVGAIAARVANLLGGPNARLATMLTAHRALLIDRDALGSFDGQSEDTWESLHIAAVPCPPAPSLSSPSANHALRQLLGSSWTLGAHLMRRLLRSRQDPRFLILGESGRGLDPHPSRAPTSTSRDSARRASPDA